ncbi:MAG TPA: carboxypeptidase regulatory-like domain-containing protein [Polyangiaceae bacterium]|nr:carboxypeptidase regulatory-like domain-containing protein [Polyangiaceae bacterium]
MPPTPNDPPPASPAAPPGPGSVSRGARLASLAWLAWAWAASRLGHLVALLALAAIPGASLRPLAPELEAPPLPADVGDRSAVLEVDVHQRGPDGVPGPALAGARVRAFTMLEGRAYLAADRPAPAGHARLADLPPGEHWIVVDAAGFARVSRMVMLVSGERSLALDTPPEHVLDVDVVDEAGAPVSAASLEVSAGDPFPVGARSDAAGRALVTRLTEGPYVVAVSHAGYDPLEVRHPTDEKPLRVVLKKLGALQVTVLGPQGTPTAATVEITSAVLWPSRRADTDPEGKVRIGGLSAATYSLRAVAGGLTSATELAVTLTQGQERELTLRLSQGMSVEVRVLDGESDPATPLVGARVALAESGLSAFPVEGVTGKSGAVTLGPIPHGGASVTVSRDDFVSVTVAVPDTPGPLVVVLPRAGTIVGRVVDGRGFPVDGARIEIVGTDLRGMPVADDPRVARARDARFDRALAGPRPLVPAGELGVMPGPLPDIPRGATASAPPLGATGGSPSGAPSEGWLTGRDGSFRARPVTPGRVRALVRHAQYVEGASELVDLAPGGTAEVKIVMRAGGLLEGRVVDAHDRPVEGAEITAMATRGTFERMTRADRDGAFAFAAMPEELTLLVERPAGQAGAPTRAEARVPEGGRASVRIVLPDPRDDLPARVLDARGSGVDGAQITVASLEPNVPLRATVFTSRRGEAKLAGAKGLALHVEIRAPRFAARSLELAADATELRVELAASESLTGEVRSARRDRLHDAEITVYAEDGAHRGRTDKEGEFTIRDVPPGPVRVRVRAAGFAPKTLEARVQESGGRRATTLPRVELDEEGLVEGLVVDGRGDPVPGARVAKDAVPVVLLAGPPPPGLAVADARGRFTLAELPQGLLSLEAYASGRGRGRGAVRVVPGRTTRDVRLVLDGEAGASEPRGAGGVAVTLGEITASHEVGIASVVEGSAAERAGLEPGDILVEIAGAPVHTIAEARARLSGPLGDDVVVKLRRRGHLESRRVPREEVRK